MRPYTPRSRCWGLAVATIITAIVAAAPAPASASRSFVKAISRTRVPYESWDMVAGFGSLWAAGSLGVARIDPSGGVIVDEVSMGALADVALGPHAVFASSYASDRVARIDPATDRIVWSAHVVGPVSLATGFGSVWVSSPVQGTLERLSSASGHILDTITLDPDPTPALGVGTEPWNRGFAPGMAAGAGSVWIASRSLGRLVRVDPVTDRVTSRITTNGHDQVDVAIANGQVWVSDFFTTGVSRIDIATERVRSFDIPGYVGQFAFGPDGVWLAYTDPEFRHAGLMRIDEDSGRIERYLRLSSAPPDGLYGLELAYGSLWTTTIDTEWSVLGELVRVDPRGSLDEPSLPPVIEPDPGILPVDVVPDVPYTSGHRCTAAGPHCRQRVDVYRPAGPGGSHPVVVLAHEHCGQAGCKRYLASLADVLAMNDAVVFNVDFGDPQNLRPEHVLRPRDLACAVRFARARAVKYGGDPSRVTLVGHLSASWSAGQVALDGDGLVGGNCLVPHGSAEPDAFVGIGDAPNRQATPAGDPGLLVRMITGSHDVHITPAAYRRANAFAARLAARGYDASAVVMPHAAFADSGSTFSNIDLGSVHPVVSVILQATL